MLKYSEYNQLKCRKEKWNGLYTLPFTFVTYQTNINKNRVKRRLNSGLKVRVVLHLSYSGENVLGTHVKWSAGVQNADIYAPREILQIAFSIPIF